MTTDQVLPQSLEAERALLGALLLDPDHIPTVTEFIDAGSFFREAHRRLFSLVLEMNERGQHPDVLAVVDRIRSAGEQDAYGGIAYVSSLPEEVGSTQNVEHYAEIIRDKAVRRGLLQAMGSIGEAVGKVGDLAELLDQAEQAVFTVSQQKGQRDWHALGTIVDEEYERIQNACENRSEVTGITTGFVDLNRLLAGFQRTDLVILAARPAMGKTALALNFVRHAALEGGVAVGVFSLEMSRGQLASRMLCAEGMVDASKMRSGHLSRERDWPKLADAVEALHQASIFIEDMPGLTLSQLRSKARRLKAARPELGLIVVDYLQLMQGSGGVRESREQAISSISRGLKGLAKELDVPILALAQLNRGVEGRPDKRPLVSDLRESGAIEQDADVIMFIYRDDYYNEDSPDKGLAEIIVGKQRNGPTGTVKLLFQGKYVRFDSLEQRAGLSDYVA